MMRWDTATASLTTMAAEDGQMERETMQRELDNCYKTFTNGFVSPEYARGATTALRQLAARLGLKNPARKEDGA
jgi:hypothetical protein